MVEVIDPGLPLRLDWALEVLDPDRALPKTDEKGKSEAVEKYWARILGPCVAGQTAENLSESVPSSCLMS